MLRVACLLAAAAFTAGCAPQRALLSRVFYYLPYYLKGPAPEARCSGKGRLRYCVHLAPKGAPEDPDTVLYYLHPSIGSEHNWRKFPISRAFYSHYRRKGLPAPKVVTVSYGSFWVLSDRPGETHEALFARFVEEWMPLVEAAVGTPSRRYLWGVSQGGLNGAILLLKRPDLWRGAVLSCPALFDTDIYADDQQVLAWGRKVGAHPSELMWGINHLRRRVGGPEAWARHDPLALAPDAPRLPPMLVQGNRHDLIGLFEGTRRFASILREAGQPVTWRPADGGHCVIDADEASAYLSRLTSEAPRPRP